MTVSRSFAPAQDDDVPAPGAPLFPILPYACMAYAEHCSRDYAAYVERLAQTREPWAGEETPGLQMLTDMNKAFFSLVWAPLGAVMAAAGDSSVP